MWCCFRPSNKGAVLMLVRRKIVTSKLIVGEALSNWCCKKKHDKLMKEAAVDDILYVRHEEGKPAKCSHRQPLLRWLLSCTQEKRKAQPKGRYEDALDKATSTNTSKVEGIHNVLQSHASFKASNARKSPLQAKALRTPSNAPKRKSVPPLIDAANMSSRVRRSEPRWRVTFPYL